jgi:hypothetical protein
MNWSLGGETCFELQVHALSERDASDASGPQ